VIEVPALALARERNWPYLETYDNADAAARAEAICR
jgi:hypothetical protein